MCVLGGGGVEGGVEGWGWGWGQTQQFQATARVGGGGVAVWLCWVVQGGVSWRGAGRGVDCLLRSSLVLSLYKDPVHVLKCTTAAGAAAATETSMTSHCHTPFSKWMRTRTQQQQGMTPAAVGSSCMARGCCQQAWHCRCSSCRRPQQHMQHQQQKQQHHHHLHQHRQQGQRQPSEESVRPAGTAQPGARVLAATS